MKFFLVLGLTSVMVFLRMHQRFSTSSPNNPYGPSPVRWQPPFGFSVKANFDGAMFGEDQEAGVVVVIRSNERQVLAALSEKLRMPVTVEILEMLAARKTAIFARDLGFN